MFSYLIKKRKKESPNVQTTFLENGQAASKRKKNHQKTSKFWFLQLQRFTFYEVSILSMWYMSIFD